MTTTERDAIAAIAQKLNKFQDEEISGLANALSELAKASPEYQIGRIAVAVDLDLNWSTAGWKTRNDPEGEKNLMDCALEGLLGDKQEHCYFVEIPLIPPPATLVVEGSVGN